MKALPLARTFAPAFTSARLRAGLTQAELARRCGCRRSTVAEWERGTAPPSLRALAVLRAAPGMSDADLGALVGLAWQADGSPPPRRRRRPMSIRSAA